MIKKYSLGTLLTKLTLNLGGHRGNQYSSGVLDTGHPLLTALTVFCMLICCERNSSRRKFTRQMSQMSVSKKARRMRDVSATRCWQSCERPRERRFFSFSPISFDSRRENLAADRSSGSIIASHSHLSFYVPPC